jgi:hypothetical protein
VSVDLVERQLTRPAVLETFVRVLVLVLDELVDVLPPEVVEVVVQVQVLSFLQEANEIATAAIANNVIFFIVFSLKFEPKVYEFF